MRTSWFTCRQKRGIGRAHGFACIVLLLVGALILNVWAGSTPAWRSSPQPLPDAPVLTEPPARYVLAATIQESGKPKCFARVFQRLAPRFQSDTPLRPFRPSHAGDGPVVSTGIGPFFHPARHLVLLRVDLPPPIRL